ncbi:MAG: zinc metallopeptidase [Christensenellales bacterium]|jgi:Zn-dependent membrane protease YugP
MNDILYILCSVLVLPVLIYSISASAKVRRIFDKHNSEYNENNFTAGEVARAILDRAGLQDVEIKPTPGSLTDNYNPKQRTVFLSQTVIDSRSVAAIGVAAHESGHAIQHAQGYVPLRIRSFLVPYAQIGSRLALPLLIMAFIFQGSALLVPRAAEYIISAALLLFASTTLFTFVTLPVEFNASRRAKAILEQGGILNARELSVAGEVLNAAAQTYVASFAMSLIQLLRMFFLFRRR